MSQYLIEIAFGPVQSFIASARRSRDLWAGSRMLSEIARAAGMELIAAKAEMIYPLRGRVEKSNEDENSNLSNVLLASVEAENEDEVRAIVDGVKAAARVQVNQFADEAWGQWEAAGVELRKELWERQVADAIEAYAAWVEIPAQGEAGKTPYRTAYERLKKTFAARKNTRDFAPMFEPDHPINGAGIPKSSFDGLRESVLPKKRKKFPARFGLSAGEQLDALGATKRVVGKQEKFTALTRLAADGWLQLIGKENLQILRDAYEPLAVLKIATRTCGNDGIYKSFPYDAGLLFPERLECAKQDAVEVGEDEKVLPKLDELKEKLLPIWRKYGQPCPYAVLVVADGDRMGKFVDTAQEAAHHEQISAAVARFADRVPQIARDNRGHSIFNGGEDLTVLFPPGSAVKGARELAEAFKAEMKEVVGLFAKDKDAKPTLRVGVAICHVLEPLGVIRMQANAAEKYAKGEAGADGQGNALGLKLHIRAGHEISVRLFFDDTQAFDYFGQWQAAYDKGRVPGRLAFDTRAIAMHCKAMGAGADVAEGEFVRLLERARQRGGESYIPDDIREALKQRQETLRAKTDSTDLSGLCRLADELIMARWLAAKTAREVGELEGGQA